MDHIEFAAMESQALNPSSCELWLGQLEKALGHDLDGSQDIDGYSLDFSVDMYKAGMSVAKAAIRIAQNKTLVF